MKDNTLILGENQRYSLDSYETRLNNNVLVVGSSGSGKTRGIVTPNLLQGIGSYVISDPKGDLYAKYKDYLMELGYEVKKLDFTNPQNSCHYNFFKYVKSTQDIVKVSHMLIKQRKGNGHLDPFWDEASQLLVQAIMAYLLEKGIKIKQTLHNILDLVNMCVIEEYDEDVSNPLDHLMEAHKKINPNSYACRMYKMFRCAAGRTLKSILISVNARLGIWDTPEIMRMTACDDINIESLGREKTVLFVVVSDTDRSLDGLVNIFFTQAMNELCRFADNKCTGNRLPIPVRFILDDFATNCKIEEFPRMIASIRSRGISAMLMIQAESQLKEGYGDDGRTIIGNCDTYVYLGGNDVDTAKSIATRCDVPVKKILNMPIGTNWVFRRGQPPVNGKNIELEDFLKAKKINIKYNIKERIEDRKIS